MSSARAGGPRGRMLGWPGVPFQLFQIVSVTRSCNATPEDLQISSQPSLPTAYLTSLKSDNSLEHRGIASCSACLPKAPPERLGGVSFFGFFQKLLCFVTVKKGG